MVSCWANAQGRVESWKAAGACVQRRRTDYDCCAGGARRCCGRGRRIPAAKALWPGPSAYSDLAATPDGRIACLFECGEKDPYDTAVCALFALEWLGGSADRVGH